MKLKVTTTSKHLDAERLLNEAERLEETGCYREAFEHLLVAAQLGDSIGQLDLGNFFANGTGVKKNMDMAAYWYKRSYRSGQPIAISACAARNLAIDKRNQRKQTSAIFWFKRAIAMKDGTAYVLLAEIYLSKKTGKKKAAALLRRVLRLRKDYASELDKEKARALLETIAED